MYKRNILVYVEEKKNIGGEKKKEKLHAVDVRNHRKKRELSSLINII